MFDKIKSILGNKKILILGFGKEGKSTLSFILDFISVREITVADANDVSLQLPDGVKCKCGNGYISGLDEYDVIIKSPGIVLNEEAKKYLGKITSQTDLFLKEFRDFTIGITGTKGKSTTTTLIHHVLETAGKDAVLTGNIGIPPLDSARKMKENSIAVFEMSCHQLEYQLVSPHIALVLNLFEDHLDHYGTREKYVEAKENIFLHQNKNDVLIINEDCREQIKKAPSTVITVGERDFFEIPKKDISLVGEHNYYNIRSARLITDIFGVSDEDFIKGLITYKPLPHRLQYVATKNGVEYYDDSISTVCQTTIQAINALENVETVIIGGMDRGIDYTELADFLKVHTLKNIILIHESGDRIAGLLDERGVSYKKADDLKSAVELSAKVTSSGAKCVMSPAAASYGYFKNFEERGDVFQTIVNNL